MRLRLYKLLDRSWGSGQHRDWGFEKPAPGFVEVVGNIVSCYNQKACFGDKVRNLIIERLR